MIRPAREADLTTLTRIYNHYVETSHVTFDVRPFRVDERRTWFEQFSTTGRHRLLVAEVDDVVVGYASSHGLRPKPAYETSVEVTVYVHHERVGAGLGRSLYEGLLTVLTNEDVHRAYGGVALPNDASVALHERLGFREIGTYEEVGRKFGRYWSVRWFEKHMGEGL
jgi:phosphinothricin acetyltransferase